VIGEIDNLRAGRNVGGGGRTDRLYLGIADDDRLVVARTAASAVDNSRVGQRNEWGVDGDVCCQAGRQRRPLRK
jgi:hypothetical protein